MQPLTIAVEADSADFQMYQSGIISGSNCGTNLNHAVLLVGYGQDNQGNPYWIIKNSWSIYWGQLGYAYIQRDTVAGGLGVCGI